MRRDRADPVWPGQGHRAADLGCARALAPQLANRFCGGLRAGASWQIGHYELILRGNNLTNSKKYGSGYVSDGVSNYFVLPPRNLFITAKVHF